MTPSSRCFSSLAPYFPSLSLPVLEATICSPCSSLQFQPLPPHPLPKGRFYTPAAAYSNLLPTYSPFLPELRVMLTLRETFLASARTQLARAGARVGPGPHTYVAVHNRRGDYGPHMASYGGALVGPGYFQSCLALLRACLASPVFLVVTDDPAWARRRITGPDVIYSLAPSMAEEEAVGTDLAILASCNHTVLTYGTFGLWGALLRGSQGVTIMSTRAKVLRRLVREAEMENFVFVDEEEDWGVYRDRVKALIKSP